MTPDSKDDKRGERRHQEERIKKARSSYDAVGDTYGGARKNPVAVGKVCKTPAPCSCYMCGNPRKHFGERSIHEKSDEQFVKTMGVAD